MITIDLSGPDGNAFALMGRARKFAKQLELDPNPIVEEMMSASSYDNVLEIFEEHFGNYVTLKRQGE